MTTTTMPDPFVSATARLLRAAPLVTCPPTTATTLTPSPVHLTIGARLIVGAGAPPALMRALRAAFTVRNPLYEEAERHNRSTADLREWLIYYDTLPDGSLALPRGATHRVYTMCEAHGARVVWEDHTRLAPVASFTERVTLSEAQERAVQAALGRRYGVIEAPPGAGKTVMGLSMGARRGQRTLWLTHTKELAYQLIDRAGMVLGLTPDEVGVVGDGQCRIGDRLTVALVQSLAQHIPSALLDSGMVVVDEAHHVAAESMAAVVRQFPARFLLGLTATPTRRDGLDEVIFWHLGPITARIDKADLADRLIAPRVIKRPTGIQPRGDSVAAIVSALVRDARRNALIVEDTAQAVRAGRRCLLLTERVPHATMLTRLLTERGVAAAALHGALGKTERARVVAALATGAVSVVVATTSLIAEGFDQPTLDYLALTTPISYAGRVTQAIGRIARAAPGKRDAVVLDYCDDCALTWSSWAKRAAVYRAEGLRIATWAQERVA